MEIQSLKLFITEDELNDLVRRHAPAADGLEDARVKITPEGVIISGQYQTSFFKVPFDTTWEAVPAGPEIHIRLTAMHVAGLPAGILRGALMKVARDVVDGKPGVRVTEDVVSINVPEAARAEGVPLRIKFTAVRLSIGALVVEAG